MDFSNERYVRLYTRDTTTWKVLTWQARFVLMSLLRKVDRSGVLDVGDEGLEGLAAVIEVPLEIVEVGLPQLLKRETVMATGSAYLLPNFLTAQETPSCDAQRKRDSRERRAATAKLQAIGTGDPMSRIVTASQIVTEPDPDAEVTKRDTSSRNVTGASRIVTKSHVESHAVTPYRAEPFLAEPRERDALAIEQDPPRPPEGPREPARALQSPEATERRGRAARLADELWSQLANAHGRLKAEGIDRGAPPIGLTHSSESPGWKAAVERCTELLDHLDLEAARAVAKHRLDFAIAEARTSDPPTLRYFAPVRFFDARSWEIATTTAVESAGSGSRAIPRGTRQARSAGADEIRHIPDWKPS